MTSDEWNQRYRARERASGRAHSSAALAGFLAALPKAPRVALDLGCGTGEDVVYLAEQGVDAIGIDASSDALDRARERAEERGVAPTWIQGDVLELPLADSSVDLVTDHGCLHHITPQDRPRYVREVARVLRPGGVLLVREEHRSSRHAHGHAHEPAHRHAQAITEDTIRALVEHAPLRVRSHVTIDDAAGHGRSTLTTLERQAIDA